MTNTNNNLTKLKLIVKKDLDDSQIEILSDNIVSFLKEKHSISSEEHIFSEEFNDLVNLYLYEHGLLETIGLKDYILVDFIDRNRFLIKDRKSTGIMFGSTILDLDINDDFGVVDFETVSFGDYIEDFVALHSISKANPKLASMILNKYITVKDRKFFRLLAFYTAVFTIHLISKKEKHNNEIKKQKLEDLINYIYEVYEDFTVDVPLWYKR
ncbi:MAG: hypothetical protein GXY87_04485 [Tissierellia bacterium]|nr:hypothetical protein [Tissierellia bacterium]